MFVQTPEEQKIRAAVEQQDKAILETLYWHPISITDWTPQEARNRIGKIEYESSLNHPKHNADWTGRRRRLRKIEKILEEYDDRPWTEFRGAERIVKALDFANAELAKMIEGLSDSPTWVEHWQFVMSVADMKVMKSLMLQDYRSIVWRPSCIRVASQSYQEIWEYSFEDPDNPTAQELREWAYQ